MTQKINITTIIPRKMTLDIMNLGQHFLTPDHLCVKIEPIVIDKHPYTVFNLSTNELGKIAGCKAFEIVDIEIDVMRK